jgi:hypothetical protein
MNKFNKRIALPIALVALAACGKQTPAPAPESAAPAKARAVAVPAAARTPAGSTRVDQLIVGNAINADGKLIVPAGGFSAKDVIHARAMVTTTAPDVVVNLRWKYQDGQIVTDGAQTIATPGTNKIDNDLTKASGWPAGNYTLDVVSGNKTLSTAKFEVK